MCKSNKIADAPFSTYLSQGKDDLVSEKSTSQPLGTVTRWFFGEGRRRHNARRDDVEAQGFSSNRGPALGVRRRYERGMFSPLIIFGAIDDQLHLPHEQTTSIHHSMHSDLLRITRVLPFVIRHSRYNMSKPSERKSLLEVFDDLSNDSRSRAFPSLDASTVSKTSNRRRPLHDVVVCLSGLTSERKERLHGVVEGLGGR